MLSIQERVCHAANRVTVALGFVAGDSGTEETKNRILDAFRVTQDLLLELSQSGRSDDISRYLAAQQPLLDTDDAEWNLLVSQQLALLQKAQLHQKTIKVVGDSLSDWVPEPVNPDDFMEALRHLEFVVTLEPESYADRWAASGTELLPLRMGDLSSVLTGLSVIASNDTTESERLAYTGVTFGASLVVDGMSKMVGIQ